MDLPAHGSGRWGFSRRPIRSTSHLPFNSPVRPWKVEAETVQSRICKSDRSPGDGAKKDTRQGMSCMRLKVIKESLFLRSVLLRLSVLICSECGVSSVTLSICVYIYIYTCTVNTGAISTALTRNCLCCHKAVWPDSKLPPWKKHEHCCSKTSGLAKVIQVHALNG